jgi:hypothetical protein
MRKEKMKIRVFLLSMVIFFILVNCRLLTGLGPTRQAGLDDEYAVYTALIKSVYQGDSRGTIVIQATTDVDKQMTGAEELQYVQRGLKGVTPAMVADLTDRSRQVLTLEQRFDLRAKVVLLTQAEIEAIFTQGGWKEFYSQYPDAQGTLVLSRVGFNAAINQALVYAGNQSNYLAGAGYYYLLALENDEWQVKQQLMVWIS